MNRYAVQKNKYFELSMIDLYTFNVIQDTQFTGFIGYHSLPRNMIFWGKEESTGIPFIYEAMGRANFETIKRYIFFADKDLFKCY